MKNCFIFGSAPIKSMPLMPSEGDFVIGADGGKDFLSSQNIIPNLIVGDFDSSQKPEGENVITFPVEKDFTDSALALAEGEKRGAERFYIYGGAGGERLDHTLANISLLATLAKKGKRGYLFDGDNVITAISKGIAFEGAKGGLSVFSFTDRSKGVTLKGVKYPLKNKSLCSAFALGVSNAFSGERSSVSLKKGILVLTFKAENLFRIIEK